jgi:hypothetical protein
MRASQSCATASPACSGRGDRPCAFNLRRLRDWDAFDKHGPAHELTQAFGETRESTRNREKPIVNITRGLDLIEAGYIEGFEAAADDSGHPMSAIYRIRRWITAENDPKSPHFNPAAETRFQFRQCHNGLEGSGVYGTRKALLSRLRLGDVEFDEPGLHFRVI